MTRNVTDWQSLIISLHELMLVTPDLERETELLRMTAERFIIIKTCRREMTSPHAPLVGR